MYLIHHCLSLFSVWLSIRLTPAFSVAPSIQLRILPTIHDIAELPNQSGHGLVVSVTTAAAATGTKAATGKITKSYATAKSTARKLC